MINGLLRYAVSAAFFALITIAAPTASAIAGPQEEAELDRKAAEQGNVDAQLRLAERYETGQGVPKDRVEAANWVRKAAEQGNVGAQYSLGHKYDRGDGVLQDYEEAVKWYRLAAEWGDARGQLALGYMYLRGNGVEENHVQAYKWFNLAASRPAPNPMVTQSAVKERDILAAVMSPAWLAEAQRLSREWKPNR